MPSTGPLFSGVTSMHLTRLNRPTPPLLSFSELELRESFWVFVKWDLIACIDWRGKMAYVGLLEMKQLRRCSAACVNWQRDIASVFCRTPCWCGALRPPLSIDISCLAHSSKPAAAAWSMGQTDGQTDTRPLHRPCSTCSASIVDNWHTCNQFIGSWIAGAHFNCVYLYAAAFNSLIVLCLVFDLLLIGEHGWRQRTKTLFIHAHLALCPAEISGNELICVGTEREITFDFCRQRWRLKEAFGQKADSCNINVLGAKTKQRTTACKYGSLRYFAAIRHLDVFDISSSDRWVFLTFYRRKVFLWFRCGSSLIFRVSQLQIRPVLGGVITETPSFQTNYLQPKAYVFIML